MTRTVSLFKGKRGEKGGAGIDGVGSGDVRGSLIDNPLVSLFHQNNVSKTVTPVWLRDSQGSIVDRYGELSLKGGDTISNLLSWSEDFSQWSDVGSYWTITNPATPDPLGGNSATRIKLDLSTYPSGVNVMGIPYTTTLTGLQTFSFWIRSFSGLVNNVGIQLVTGGTVFTLSDPVTDDWQRISYTVNVFSPGAGTFYINVYGLSGIEFDVFGAQFEENSQIGDYYKTTGSPVSGVNPESRWRSNQLGYLIEGEKTNLCLFSQNLDGSDWIISGGNVSAFSGKDPAGNAGSRIQVNFDSFNVSLAQDVIITEDDIYTVSCWIYVNNGSLDSLLASVGNGIGVPFDLELLTSGLTRVSVLCTAGNVDNFSITLTSGDLSSEVVVFGVQLERGRLSSYINTQDEPAIKKTDLVSLGYEGNFPLPSSSWTLLFTSVLQVDLIGDRYVFHNGLSGNDEFSLRYNVNDIYIKNGSVESSFSLSGVNVEVVFNGSLMGVFSDAKLISFSVISLPSSAIATTMFIGTDENQTNSLEAFLADFIFYDEALTVDELRYIRGSDSGRS